ncbi:restriction endonuclease subunit S [Dickeya dianthicola]|uniref:restriction endonuclease subunit S n=1 Tax=Dickeya dianthicola TaxID=204039 RepID=UPI001BDE9AD9|nr:restriction endonuclease subunit S [Dickeya dianthicola]MBT1430820.1 restriction endonuclease subunit S [Dickeya dianthicola]
MSDQINSTLGELVAAGGGIIHTGPFGSQLHAADYVSEGIPCIMPANMKDNRVNLSGIAFISDDDAKRLSKYFGCLLLRPGEKFDSNYLTYYLSTPRIQAWIISQAVGATMPNLNTGILFRIPFTGPEKPIQEKISATLRSIDDKIDLNNRINAELEAMAKTLYDYWFVQFDFPDANGKPYKTSGGKMEYNATLKRKIPVGWLASNILLLAELLGGGTPTKANSTYWNGSIPFFTPTDSGKNIYSLSTQDNITEVALKKSSTRLFKKNTVFITARGSVGRLALNAVPMAMNQSCYALSTKQGVSFVFLYYLAKELIHHLEVKATGSVFNSIVSNDIEHTYLALPNNIKLIEEYAEKTEPLFEKIELLTKENQQLAVLRDWLLPLLMNGQVTVK